MDMGLKNKTAVVLGGSKGIGFAIAKEFLKEGSKVAICARNSQELKKAAEELMELGEVYYESVDVTDDKKLYQFAENVAKRFHGIDCWINNVGATLSKEGNEYTSEEIDKITSICFKSAIFGCQAAFRYMKETGGSIVNISSLAARCPTAGRSTLYGPLKAAIVNLTNTFAGEYAAYGVRVTCIMPGFTLTPMVRETISEEELQYNAGGTLLQRLAEPDEIAKPVIFLASDAASYMTGTTIEVSGGRSVTLNPTFSFEQKKRIM